MCSIPGITGECANVCLPLACTYSHSCISGAVVPHLCGYRFLLPTHQHFPLSLLPTNHHTLKGRGAAIVHPGSFIVPLRRAWCTFLPSMCIKNRTCEAQAVILSLRERLRVLFDPFLEPACKCIRHEKYSEVRCAKYPCYSSTQLATAWSCHILLVLSFSTPWGNPALSPLHPVKCALTLR